MTRKGVGDAGGWACLAVAERERGAGADREARILAGLWALMDAEAVRQGWRLTQEPGAKCCAPTSS